MSGRKASNNPGMCHIKGQLSGLCSPTRARNQFYSLSLGTTKTTLHCQMPVIHAAFNFIFNIMPRAPKDGPGPTNFEQHHLFRVSAISFPRTPARPVTQYRHTACWVDISMSFKAPHILLHIFLSNTSTNFSYVRDKAQHCLRGAGGGAVG